MRSSFFRSGALVLATCGFVAAASSVASASIILVNGTVAGSFIDIGAQGFGNAPRLLTLQTNGFESGGVTPVDQVTGQAVPGANKSTTPTLTALGWDTGADVGIGFNAGQSGHTALTLQTLTLTIYNGATAVGSFSLAAPVQFSGDDLGLQTGNGNGVFAFGLDAGQQLSYNLLLAAQAPGSTLYAGLAASLGCNTTPSATCQVTNDGPDSFLGFDRLAPVPGPLAGAGLPGLILACGGLMVLARRRKQAADA